MNPTFTRYALTVVTSVAIGFLLAWYLLDNEVDASLTTDESEPKVLYWVAPMDPNFRRDKPGKSPMGMDLVPVYADGIESENDVVQVSSAMIQNFGVRSERVRFSTLNQKVKTVGFIEYDENALHHIHTRVEGWIEMLSVKAEGDPITKGQVLFEIYSPALVNAQSEFLMAHASNQGSLIQATQERLRALGLTDEQITELIETETPSSRVRVHAKSDGIVQMLGIREGIYVVPATHVMSIAEPDKVWVLADLMQVHSRLVDKGQKVKIQLDALPGRSYNGYVDYLYPEVDPVTRGLKVRILFDDSSLVLKPNMFAQVTIEVPAESAVLNVPVSAVIRGEPADRVIADLGDGKYRAIPITVGDTIEGRTVVLSGLDRDQLVVTSAQFLIDSESNLDSALARFEDNSEAAQNHQHSH